MHYDIIYHVYHYMIYKFGHTILFNLIHVAIHDSIAVRKQAMPRRHHPRTHRDDASMPARCSAQRSVEVPTFAK